MHSLKKYLIENLTCLQMFTQMSYFYFHNKATPRYTTSSRDSLEPLFSDTIITKFLLLLLVLIDLKY